MSESEKEISSANGSGNGNGSDNDEVKPPKNDVNVEEQREQDDKMDDVPLDTPTTVETPTIEVSESSAHSAYNNEPPHEQEKQEQQQQQQQSQTQSQQHLKEAPRRRSRRTPSIALSMSSTSSGKQTVSPMVFVKKALELISNSKDARKITALDSAVKKALKQMNEDDELPQPGVIFQPLHIVCSQSNSSELKSTALDAIAKLFNFAYLEEPEPEPVDPSSGVTPPPSIPLLDRAVNTVCECRKNDTSNDHNVEMQVVSALSSAVMQSELMVHEKSLLRAIREVYEIFVKSTSNNNQTTAQITLLMMVDAVFERLKKGTTLPSEQQSVDSPQPEDVEQQQQQQAETEEETEQKMTLEEMENRGEERHLEDDSGSEITNDAAVKDAFLVFRTLCKLSGRVQDNADLDSRSHFMRSKLITLHLIHHVLKNHMSVFLSKDIILRSNTNGEETFVEAIRDYVCFTMVRNMVSISPPVFEICAEIFWLVLSNLRPPFKRHLEPILQQYFKICEMATTPVHQKQFFLSIVQRICNDPRALVELYLNYDCDGNSTVNPYQRIIEILVKFARSHVNITHMQLQNYHDSRHRSIAVYNLSSPPALSIASVTTNNHAPEQPLYPVQYAMKMAAIQSIVAILRSLLTWSQRTSTAIANGKIPGTPKPDSDEVTNASDTSLPDSSGANTPHRNDIAAAAVAAAAATANGNGNSTVAMDDPAHFAYSKQRKTELHEAIEEFRFKPKRGIEKLIKLGFIEDAEPLSVAKFCLSHQELDKAALGEYLGEGDEYNINVMHAFVDEMDFANMGFVEGIRQFLQSFRLPGEAQKIDRFMLKFAERYYKQNPGFFADASVAYVLAYSVILLNTDLHSSKIKDRRMSPEDFIKNNSGINKEEGSEEERDLPREFLMEIYNEIAGNEIILETEQQAALMRSDGAPSAQPVFTLFRKDNQREAYLQASREMSNQAEKMFQNLVGKGTQVVQAGGRFYIASHVDHVKPMFQVAWGSIYVGFSGIFQESDDTEVVKMCIDAFKYSIRLACWFPGGDLQDDTPRKSLVNAMEMFTNLQSPGELKMKNVEAIKVLLDIGLTEGNMLEDSWKNVLTCVSQLQRLQLINSGIDSNSIPDVSNARIARPSTDSLKRPSIGGHKRGSVHQTTFYSPEVRNALNAKELSIAMDRIFEQTAKLSGNAVVHFVKALSQVSLEEIQSSGNHQHPRTDALSKMVDVCYYNMGRIRLEWSQIWQTLGEQFNVVCCHSNDRVVQFALDALRQLSLRFLTIEELSHFKFQRDFLQPFEHVMLNNKDLNAREMVLDCLDQMIKARSSNIRSGWSRMFQVFAAAASSPEILAHTFKIVKDIYDQHLNQIIAQDSFGHMVNCLSAIAKNPKDQRTALHAIELMKNTIGKVLEVGEQDKPKRGSMWYAILQSFQSVIIQSRDVEVRSRALNYLFDSLTEYGGTFDSDTWDSICQNLLFPIFDTLGKQQYDEEAVWLNTTMVQALRNMIALLTHYFDTLERLLGGFLDLLVRCIDQDNDTVSKIGSSCLGQLITQNVARFNKHHWEQIVDKIDLLFQNTTAHEVFTIAPPDGTSHEGSSSPPGDANSRRERQGSIASVGLENERAATTSTQFEERQRLFRPTIIKSVLQRLMISTVNDLITTETVFNSMPTKEMLRIAEMLKQSYEFSRKFNNDRELRMRIWKQRYMQDMPNLLTQESISALTYVNLMMRLYRHSTKLDHTEQQRIESELIPQCVGILQDYNESDFSQKRYISTLWPVVCAILTEYQQISDEQLKKTMPQLYPHFIGLLSKDMVPEVRSALQDLLERLGKVMFT